MALKAARRFPSTSLPQRYLRSFAARFNLRDVLPLFTPSIFFLAFRNSPPIQSVHGGPLDDQGLVQDFPSIESSDAVQGTLTPSASANSLDRTELPLLFAFMLTWYGFWLWLSAGPSSHRPTLST